MQVTKREEVLFKVNRHLSQYFIRIENIRQRQTERVSTNYEYLKAKKSMRVNHFHNQK